ncbi:MAG: glycosyltransferase family 4 protein [Gammaproteobacteria bacterium]|nr:glycosyltransferase family 4 protein [Gammaproteobacteria bacterium]
MKILLTTPYDISQANYGGAVRTIELAAALTRVGHEVKILSANNPVGDNYMFKSFTPIGHFFNPFFILKYILVLSRFQPDLIIAAFPYQSVMLLPIARVKGVPVIYDAHNIEHLRFLRMGKRRAARIVKLFEGLMMAHSVATICVSGEEESYVRERFRRPTVLVPNGVTISERKTAKNREYSFCFFGALDYLPNTNALAFLREAWPDIKNECPGATLLVVGRNPPQWSRSVEDWQVLGEVSSVPEAISKARILLCPINEGGGSRLKIIEAVANGLLVLSTKFGAEGFEQLANQGSVVIAPIEDFANAAVMLMRQDIDHAEIAATAAPFEWTELVKELQSLEIFRADEEQRQS